MASFGVTGQMDYRTMSHLAEVRSRPGLHYDFQLGIRLKSAKKKLFHWPEPLYSGCCVRAFFFTAGDPNGGLEVEYNWRWFLKIDIYNGNVSTYFGDKRRTKSSKHHGTIKVEKNRYTSIGVIIRDHHFGALFEKQEVGYHNMMTIEGYKWDVNIYSQSMFLTSFHVYDETSRHFPANGLNQAYLTLDHNEFFLTPIGSVVSVELVYKGNQNDVVTVRLEKDGPEAKYTGVPLNTNDQFTVIVENTINGWYVTVSFEGPNQTPRHIRRKWIDYYTRPTFSWNCTVMRILAVCAPIPSRHRH